MCRSSAATEVLSGITAPNTPASWYWSAASFRSRWFGLLNSTPWSRQLRAQRRSVRWGWYPGACHSSHAITAGLPRRSPTSHSGRHRRASIGLLTWRDRNVSASPMPQRSSARRKASRRRGRSRSRRLAALCGRTRREPICRIPTPRSAAHPSETFWRHSHGLAVSKTHVHVRFSRFTHVATCAERKDRTCTCVPDTMRGWGWLNGEGLELGEQLAHGVFGISEEQS